MFVKRLALQYFRNHENSYIEPGRLNLFVGHNNAGKSSILAGLEWALTGKCYWTDKAGRGAADLVQAGAKSCQVAAEINGCPGIVRTMPPHALQVGKKKSISTAQAAIYNALDGQRADTASAQALSIALNANAFLGLTPNEQKSYLFDVYARRWEFGEIMGHLDGWLIRHNYDDETRAEIIKTARRMWPENIGGGPEMIDGIEKKARDLRRDAKRDRDRTNAALNEFEPIRLPDECSTQDGPQVAEYLVKIRSERDQLLQAAAGAKEQAARAQHLENTCQRLFKTGQDLTAKIQQTQEQIKQINVPADLDTLAAQVENGWKRLETMRGELADLEGRANTITRALDALGHADGRCPLAPDLVECRMSTQDLQTLIKDLAGEAEKATAAHKAAAGKYEAERTEQKKREKDSRAAQDAATAREYLTKKLADLESQRQDTLASLKESHHELETVQATATPPQPDNRLAELDEEIKNLEDLARRVQWAAKQQAQEAQLIADAKAYDKDARDAEALVKATGPDGIRRGLLAELVEPFTQRVNRTLNLITSGYALTIGDDMLPLVQVPSGAVLHPRLLSTSEYLRVSIAIQEALANAAGLNFLAIDGADLLDQDNRDLLMGGLLDLAEEYEQVFVFSTIGDVQPVNPGLPQVKMFYVEGGNVKEI